MEQEQSQQQNSEMSPEDAKASLGIATMLQSQLMPQEETTSPAEEPGTQEQPEQQEEVKTQIEGLETRLMDEIQTLKSELKTQGDGKAELAEFKAQIEEILNSSD